MNESAPGHMRERIERTWLGERMRLHLVQLVIAFGGTHSIACSPDRSWFGLGAPEQA